MRKFNVGDRLYDISLGLVEIIKITEIIDDGHEITILATGMFSESEFPESEIGESVFTSWEDASQKLSEICERTIFCDDIYNL